MEHIVMHPRQPFDPQRAAFAILLIIIALYAIIILAGVSNCLVYARAIIDGTYKCDPGNRLFDLAMQLGTIAGLAAGYLLSSRK